MPKYPIGPEKEKALEALMKALDIAEDELVEKFIRGSGKGGQKINKTASCVYIRHTSSGIEIKCQKTRSQALNRYYARKELCEELEARKLGVESKKEQEYEKLRRQKRKRSKRAKEKILENKKQRAQVKQRRKTPSAE